MDHTSTLNLTPTDPVALAHRSRRGGRQDRPTTLADRDAQLFLSPGFLPPEEALQSTDEPITFKGLDHDYRLGRWLLHKPLRYPVRYDEVQRVDFAGGQTSRMDPSIAASRPYTAPGNQSRDAPLEILQRPHLCATASTTSGSRMRARSRP